MARSMSIACMMSSANSIPPRLWCDRRGADGFDQALFVAIPIAFPIRCIAALAEYVSECSPVEQPASVGKAPHQRPDHLLMGEVFDEQRDLTHRSRLSGSAPRRGGSPRRHLPCRPVLDRRRRGGPSAPTAVRRRRGRSRSGGRFDAPRTGNHPVAGRAGSENAW